MFSQLIKDLNEKETTIAVIRRLVFEINKMNGMYGLDGALSVQVDEDTGAFVGFQEYETTYTRQKREMEQELDKPT